MLATPSFLTNYHSNKINSLDIVATNCLQPLVIALGGRVVTIINSDNNSEKKTFIVNKVQNVAARILAGICALILFPVTLAGVVLRTLSSSHKKLVQDEKNFILDQKTINSNYTEFLQQIATPAHSIAQTVDRLNNIVTFVITSCEGKENLDLLPLFAKLSEDVTILSQSVPTMNFNELRSYKQVLSKALQKLNTQELAFANIGTEHRKARTHYYKSFSTDHFAHSLLTKKQVSCLKIKLDELAFEKGNENEMIEQLKQTYSAPLTPSSVTWLHGSQSPTIVSMINSDNLLKSSGQLRADNQFAYGGENCKGMFGINTKRISGVGLSDHATALCYALGLVLQIDETATLCSSDPEKCIEFYTKTIDEWIQSKDYWSLYVTYTNQSVPTALTNFHRHMKILWSLNSQQFEVQLLPKIHKMLSQLESIINANKNDKDAINTADIATSLKEKLFTPILSFKETLFVYTDEDKKIIKEFYPVIFGTGQLNLAEKHTSLPKEKTAFRVPDSNTKEYAYEGSLKLGDELSFMFVPQSMVALTKGRLLKANIHNVHVTNIEALKIATQFDQFKKHKARSKV